MHSALGSSCAMEKAAVVRRSPMSFGTSGRHIKQNCVRFPEHEPLVLERRHFAVWVQSEVLGRQLVTAPEVNALYLTIEREMTLQCQDTERTRRWQKDIEFHSGKPPNLV